MDVVEEIKGRLSVEDVVGRYVELKRSGASYKGLCPFHQEKTPSFYVTPSRGSYHCFGCGKGGDIFSFMMELERLPFPDALRRLADQAGVTVPEREAQKPSLKNRLYEANEAALRFFREVLATEQGSRARAYLEGRGFGREAVDLFDLGFAPEGREALVQRLHQAGFDDRVLLAAGLGLQDDVGGKARDRFRGRLIFPIRDASRKISGFGGRTLGDAQPKYLNSPQTEIFDKSGVLFGIHLAQDAIRQAGRAVLVEGYLDAVRAHLAGYTNVVASLGTAVTAQQLRSLSRLTDTVIVALDPDQAGQVAAARTFLAALAEVTQARGRAAGAAGAVDLRVARLPEERGDPDELIRAQPEVWEEVLAAAKPAFDFFFEQTMAGLDRSSDAWRQEAIDRLLPVIQQLSSSAGWQAVALEKLARETGVDVRTLQRSLPASGARAQDRKRPPQRAGQEVVTDTTARSLTTDPKTQIERSLLALLLGAMIVPAEAQELLRIEPLNDPAHAAIIYRLLEWQSTGNLDYEMFSETLTDEQRTLCDELRSSVLPLPEEDKLTIGIEFHLARLQHFGIQAQLARATQVLESAAPEDKSRVVGDVSELMDRRRLVELSLSRLSRLAVQATARDPG